MNTSTPDRPASSPTERKAALQAAIERDRRVALVVNTRSRKGQDLFEHACEMLKRRDFDCADSFAVKDPSRFGEIARGMVAKGHKLIAIGGGDGSLSSAVDYFVGKDVVFGVLPLGTANSFARTLDLPLDLEGAVDVVTGGRVVDVDVGRIGDDWFANAAAIGLPASINADIPHGLKKIGGRLGYLGFAAYKLATHKPFRVTLAEPGGEPRSYDALEVRIGNGGHLGGLLVTPEASVEDRSLTIQLVVGSNAAPLVRTWWRSGFGHPPRDADVVTLKTRGMRIETDPVQPVSVDGEVLTRSPIDVSVGEQALFVMAPKGSAALV